MQSIIIIMDTAVVTSSATSADNLPASPLDEEMTTSREIHQSPPSVDSSDGPNNPNTTHKEVTTLPPSSSNSSSSHDIGLNLSMDVEALNSQLHLVSSSNEGGGGTIASAPEEHGNNNNSSCNNNDKSNNAAEDKVPLVPNSDDGLSPIPTTDASKNDIVSQEVSVANENQPSSASLSKEEQLEHRILHLEQSLQQLSQFCQTILQNQQRQLLKQRRQSENGGQGGDDGAEEDDNTPSTPTEQDVNSSNANNNQWHPSTTQYAPLDSPDASLNNGRTTSSSSDEERANLQRNSLSVKLGVTPYNNITNSTNRNQNNNSNSRSNGGNGNGGNNKGKRGKELDAQKKTMSMLFLDIEPGQSRGPNLITLDAVADDNVVDDDDDAGGNGDDDGVVRGDGSENGGGSSGNNGDGNGGEEGSVVSNNTHNETTEGGRNKIEAASSPSSSPILRRQASQSSPTLRTVVEKSPVHTFFGNNGYYKEDMFNKINIDL